MCRDGMRAPSRKQQPRQQQHAVRKNPNVEKAVSTRYEGRATSNNNRAAHPQNPYESSDSEKLMRDVVKTSHG